MDEFIQQLSNMTAPEILELVGSWVLRVIFGIFAIFTAYYGKKIFKLEKGETSTMTKTKYYTEQERPPFEPTKFTRYIPEYKLDEATGVLKETGGKIDVQEMVQSYADCALEKVLEKFLPGQNAAKIIAEQNPVSDEQFGEAAYRDDLKDLGDLYAEAEVLREKYNLGDDLSAVEVFKQVNAMAENNAAYIKGLTKTQEATPVVTEPTYEELLKAWKEAQNEKA